MLIKDIAQLLLTEIKQRSTLVLAIDGRCAAGKTTLAARLAELCDCNVIHMDHFFLCSKQNTMERLQQAGGNMDYVRFCEEMYWSSFLVTLCSEIMLYIETPLVSYSYSLNEVSHSCTS